MSLRRYENMKILINLTKLQFYSPNFNFAKVSTIIFVFFSPHASSKAAPYAIMLTNLHAHR